MVYSWAYTRWIGPNRNFRLFCPRVWFEYGLKWFEYGLSWRTLGWFINGSRLNIRLGQVMQASDWKKGGMLGPSIWGWPQPEISVVATLAPTRGYPQIRWKSGWIASELTRKYQYKTERYRGISSWHKKSSWIFPLKPPEMFRNLSALNDNRDWIPFLGGLKKHNTVFH